MNDRLLHLREKMRNSSLDAMLISNPDNRRYISGFTGSAGYLLITFEEAILATDFRYIEQSTQEASDFEIFRISGTVNWLNNLLDRLQIKKLGFEASDLTVNLHALMLDEIIKVKPSQPNFIPTTELVEPLRMVKDSNEIALISKAVELADDAFLAVSPNIKVGDSELLVAWQIEKTMKEMGADSISFDTIVASGPNGAKPHHQPSERKIQAGEPIVIDMGAKFQGYCSDMTRTICIGEPEPKLKEIYDIVLGAQLTAIATVSSIMCSGDADRIARDIINEAGYGDLFGHSLGHGIGLEVHENPRVGPGGNDLLVNGTIFTIEPGIYISGWGGVRIEDTVIMENGSVRTLNKSHKLQNPRSS
jgi:Xaa-Pro aminopeptidase